jgi:hypothetical protein
MKCSDSDRKSSPLGVPRAPSKLPLHIGSSPSPPPSSGEKRNAESSLMTVGKKRVLCALALRWLFLSALASLRWLSPCCPPPRLAPSYPRLRRGWACRHGPRTLCTRARSPTGGRALAGPALAWAAGRWLALAPATGHRLVAPLPVCGFGGGGPEKPWATREQGVPRGGGLWQGRRWLGWQGCGWCWLRRQGAGWLQRVLLGLFLLLAKIEAI